MIRLFVGLELPAELREELFALRGRLSGARWVEPDNMHLTLRFIGEVDEDVADDIDEVLTGLSAPAFDLTLRGLGQFSKGSLAHTLWAGVEPNPALTHLQGKVDRAMVRQVELPHDRRKYTPHVTLARLKSVSLERCVQFITEAGVIRFPPFAVTHFTLFSSALTKNGAAYTPERRYALSGADTPVAAE